MSEKFDNLTEQNVMKSAMRKDLNVDSSSSSAIAPEFGLEKRTSNVALTASSEKGCIPTKKKKALTWDEHAIEEHDLLRGTRMKVCRIILL